MTAEPPVSAPPISPRRREASSSGRAGPHPHWSLLGGITTPADLRALSPPALVSLAEEIRSFLIENVARTGGHLCSNLGVVELTIAVHRGFSSPRGMILFDTGPQAYVHKILTGRRDDFDLL